MNFIINILFYILLAIAVIWHWQSASDTMKDFIFYTVFLITWVQGNFLMYKIESLKKKLKIKENNE